MTDSPLPATEAQLRDVVVKLAQVRETLSPTEQALLDDMTVSSLTRSAGEVKSFACDKLAGLRTTFLTPSRIGSHHGDAVSAMLNRALGDQPVITSRGVEEVVDVGGPTTIPPFRSRERAGT